MAFDFAQADKKNILGFTIYLLLLILKNSVFL
jgi:hypothetical protein